MSYIERDVTLNIDGKTAKFDDMVYIFKGDRDIQLNIKIIDTKMKFSRTNISGNVLTPLPKGCYARVGLVKPKGGDPVIRDRVAIEDDKVKFLIDSTVCDELDEVGIHKIQIQIYALDDDASPRWTLPSAAELEVCKPDVDFDGITPIVGSAKAGLSMTISEGDTTIVDFNPDGTYNKTIWSSGDVISTEKLNKIENVLDHNVNKLNEHDTQIKEMAKQVDLEVATKFGVPFNIKTPIPMISFMDDDGNELVWTWLRELFNRKGVPFCMCIPSDFIGKNGTVTAEQLNILEAEGHEIASHTKSHANLNGITLEQALIENRDSKIEIEKCGVHCNTMVYPWGQRGDANKKAITRNYYRCGITTDAGSVVKLNKPPFYTYNLGRNSYDTQTLDWCKGAVDQAQNQNAWCIFMLHCGQLNDTKKAELEMLVDYIISKNIKIVNIQQGLNQMGNIIEVGDNTESSDYFIIGGDGKVYSKDKAGTKIYSRNDIDFSTDITTLENNIIAIGTTTNTIDSPSGHGGIIKFENIDDKGFKRVVHKQINNPAEYIKVLKQDGTYTKWYRNLVGQKHHRKYIAFGTNLGIGECRERIIDVTGIIFGDIICATPRVALPNGIIYSSSIVENGKVAIRLYNATQSIITDVLNYEWVITSIAEC